MVGHVWGHPLSLSTLPFQGHCKVLNIWGLGLDAVKLGGWAEFPFPLYYLKGRKGEEEGTSGETSRVTKPNDPETIGGRKQPRFYSCLFKPINLPPRPSASSNQDQSHDTGKRQRQSPVSIPGPEDGEEGEVPPAFSGELSIII